MGALRPLAPLRRFGVLSFFSSIGAGLLVLGQRGRQPELTCEEAAHAVKAVAPGTTVIPSKKENFHIFRPYLVDSWYRLFCRILGVLGILPIIGPFIGGYFNLEWWRSVMRDVQVAGRKVKFTGGYREYVWVAFTNNILTFLTLGIYDLLGFSSRRFATFLDDHI